MKIVVSKRKESKKRKDPLITRVPLSTNVTIKCVDHWAKDSCVCVIEGIARSHLRLHTPKLTTLIDSNPTGDVDMRFQPGLRLSSEMFEFIHVSGSELSPKKRSRTLREWTSRTDKTRAFIEYMYGKYGLAGLQELVAIATIYGAERLLGHVVDYEVMLFKAMKRCQYDKLIRVVDKGMMQSKPNTTHKAVVRWKFICSSV